MGVSMGERCGAASCRSWALGIAQCPSSSTQPDPPQPYHPSALPSVLPSALPDALPGALWPESHALWCTGVGYSGSAGGAV